MPDSVKFDLNQLKKTISAQKEEQHNKLVALGNVPEGAIMKTNKKAFLNELVASMHHGVKTSASEAIKAVNETVEAREGKPVAVAKNNGKYVPPRRKQQINEVQEYANAPTRTGASDWGMSPNGSINLNPRGGGYGDERDAQFDRDFNNANQRFDEMMMNNNPVVANHPRMRQYAPQQEYVVETPPSHLNEQVQTLTEKIEKNLDKMVESAFKNVLTNIYSKQIIQESLVEFLQTNDGLKVIGRAITEIAKRNKEKQGLK